MLGHCASPSSGVLVIQDTTPDGNALSKPVAEAKRSMIHARRYPVESNPAATHSLSGSGQKGVGHCPIADNQLRV